MRFPLSVEELLALVCRAAAVHAVNLFLAVYKTLQAVAAGFRTHSSRSTLNILIYPDCVQVLSTQIQESFVQTASVTAGQYWLRGDSLICTAIDVLAVAGQMLAGMQAL